MDQTIEQNLRQHYTDCTFHTHVSMVQPRGKYQYNRQDLDTFWEIYENSLDEDGELIVGFAEKPQHYLPVLVDVDLKMKDDDHDISFLYTDEHVRKIIQVYQEVLRNIVEECTDDNLLCVFLNKEPYRINKDDSSYIKHGFHLHFPNLFLHIKEQEVHLIPRVQEIVTKRKIFEDMGFENCGNLIDKSYCKVPWLVYGSRKSEDAQPYKLHKIFNYDLQELTIENAFKDYSIYNYREHKITIRGKIQHYLPQIMSILIYGRSTKDMKTGLISPIKEKMKNVSDDRKKEYDTVTTNEALNIARRLIVMLASFRSEDRNEWMTIGWILYNIGDSTRDALDIWLEFSSRAESYDESVCIFEWERMAKTDLGLGTLKYFASIDNPSMYKEFKDEQIRDKAINSFNGSHNDLAKLLFEEYGNEFVCSSIVNKTWYQYSKNASKWEQMEDGTFLRSRISNELVRILEPIGTEHLKNQIRAADKVVAKDNEAGLKQIQKICMNLKTSSFKNHIMREAQEVFYDRKFRDKLDTNPYIIAFQNGVYDLKLNVFRNGRPEDYLSKSMPIDFKEFKEDDNEVREVHNFLEKVFPDRSVRQYFMDMSSDVFVGGNHQKVVLFWTGEGDNGKSVTQTFFEKMFGPLAIKFNTTVITGKKPANGGTWADLARAGGGVRWATLEEPDENETINTGILKSLSGNDSIYARELFERGRDAREILPMFKLTFICNKLPGFSGSGAALWNRVRVIPFESTFCKPDNPAPTTYEEQLRQKRFPMDKELSQRIPYLVEAFAWILLEHRKKLTIRVEPEKVTMATAAYRRQNDTYRQYVEEYIIEDSKYSISITELYNSFKEWYKDSLPHHSIPIKNVIKDYFIKLWGEPIRNKWIGYKIRSIQDDIDDGNILMLEESDLANNNLPPM